LRGRIGSAGVALHGYLTALGKEGVDVRTVQKLAGHSTMKLTERYSHRRDDDLADGVNKLPSFLPGQGRPQLPYPSLRQTPKRGSIGEHFGGQGCRNEPAPVAPNPTGRCSLEDDRGQARAYEKGWLRGLEPPTFRSTV
jgi:hypothetical protein